MNRLRVIPYITGKGRAFIGSRDGVTAIEFSMLALPFFATVFAIAETAMVMFAGLTLDSSTAEAARAVRTGEAIYKKYSKDQFRGILCQSSLDLFDCNKIYFDLREYEKYETLPSEIPITNGKLNSSQFKYQTGEPDSIMMLRVYYEWPIITDIMHRYLTKMSDGKFLLSSVSTVRIEPIDVD